MTHHPKAIDAKRVSDASHIVRGRANASTRQRRRATIAWAVVAHPPKAQGRGRFEQRRGRCANVGRAMMPENRHRITPRVNDAFIDVQIAAVWQGQNALSHHGFSIETLLESRKWSPLGPANEGSIPLAGQLLDAIDDVLASAGFEPGEKGAHVFFDSPGREV